MQTDFDVGYAQGNDVVRVRSTQNLTELWTELKKSQSTTSSWCDGLYPNCKKKDISINEDKDPDTEPIPKKKRNKLTRKKKYKR